MAPTSKPLWPGKFHGKGRRLIAIAGWDGLDGAAEVEL